MNAVLSKCRVAAPRAKRYVLAAMCLAVLMAQLDTSVVNLAVKSIGADFHAGTNTLQWVIDVYNLLYASLLLTAGALGDQQEFVRRHAASQRAQREHADAENENAAACSRWARWL